MDLESLREFCLSLPAAEESLPFGPETLVFKVCGKMFALVPLDTGDCRVNLKCDPEQAVQLREDHPGVILPGWHMNKVHWNTVHCDAGLSGAMVREMVRRSYDLIVAGLSRKDKTLLDEMA